MKIKILGGGCPKCKKLAKLAEEAAAELNLDFEIEKVTDINEIISYGVMLTPALVVDGEVLVSGSVPSKEEITRRLSGN